MHSTVCVVNSEATDAARNVRRGAVDGPADARMYDWFIGCQARTVLDFKKDEVALSVLASVMITPDLVVASDVGQAVLACVRLADGVGGFWNASAATSEAEQLQAWRVQQNTRTQLLVKIPGGGVGRRPGGAGMRASVKRG